MAWKELNIMMQRSEFVERAVGEEDSMSQLAREYGISRKTAYKWLGRFKEAGRAGLEDHSRAPHRHPNALSPTMEKEILEWKERKPHWGAPKIHALMDPEQRPCESTVSNVLARHGLTRQVRRRGRATPGPAVLVEGEAANAVWCADFKGHFQTRDGARCEALTISDAHTRYLLRCTALREGIGFKAVQPMFEMTFREYGMPWVIRTDNGPPFASHGLGGLSQLSVWWLRLGIRLERSRPGHPQDNGRHERMHRSLGEATANPPQATLPRQQKSFDVFRLEFNRERPHEALGQKPPASLYTPSTREFPHRLPPPENYPQHWVKRQVRQNGQIKWCGTMVYVSQALCQEQIGLELVGEDLWAIYFQSLQLGYLDQRRKRIRRLEQLQWRPLT